MNDRTLIDDPYYSYNGEREKIDDLLSERLANDTSDKVIVVLSKVYNDPNQE